MYYDSAQLCYKWGNSEDGSDDARSQRSCGSYSDHGTQGQAGVYRAQMRSPDARSQRSWNGYSDDGKRSSAESGYDEFDEEVHRIEELISQYHEANMTARRAIKLAEVRYGNGEGHYSDRMYFDSARREHGKSSSAAFQVEKCVSHRESGEIWPVFENFRDYREVLNGIRARADEMENRMGKLGQQMGFIEPMGGKGAWLRRAQSELTRKKTEVVELEEEVRFLKEGPPGQPQMVEEARSLAGGPGGRRKNGQAEADRRLPNTMYYNNTPFLRSGPQSRSGGQVNRKGVHKPRWGSRGRGVIRAQGLRLQ